MEAAVARQIRLLGLVDVSFRSITENPITLLVASTCWTNIPSCILLKYSFNSMISYFEIRYLMRRDHIVNIVLQARSGTSILRTTYHPRCDACGQYPSFKKFLDLVVIIYNIIWLPWTSVWAEIAGVSVEGSKFIDLDWTSLVRFHFLRTLK